MMIPTRSLMNILNGGYSKKYRLTNGPTKPGAAKAACLKKFSTSDKAAPASNKRCDNEQTDRQLAKTAGLEPAGLLPRLGRRRLVYAARRRGRDTIPDRWRLDDAIFGLSRFDRAGGIRAVDRLRGGTGDQPGVCRGRAGGRSGQTLRGPGGRRSVA